MVKNHLKRHATPTSWGILRKENKYIMRPKPGPHPLALSLPLSVFLKREQHAATTREVKKLLQKQAVLIDGYRRKDHKFTIGLMDIISLELSDKHYRITLDGKGRMAHQEIKKEESGHKTCKIIAKTKIKGGKTQLNLHDSKNLLIDKDEHNVGDSIVLDLKTKKIKKHLKLGKGAKVMLTGGKHVGSIGTIEEIKENTILFKKDKEKVQTLKRYAFVLEQ